MNTKTKFDQYNYDRQLIEKLTGVSFKGYLVPQNQPGISLQESVPGYEHKVVFSWRSRHFAAVDTYAHLYEVISKVKQYANNSNLVNFYEVIQEGPQKLYFDVDISPKDDNPDKPNPHKVQFPLPLVYADTVRDHIIWAIATYFNKHVTSDKYPIESEPKHFSLEHDILLFSSHSPDGMKYSYHIIVDNYKFSYSGACKHAAKEIMSYVPEQFQQWMDMKVYNANRQFRTYLSSKEPGNTSKPIRPKVMNDTWIFAGKLITWRPRVNRDPRWNDENLKDLVRFERSLVTQVQTCTIPVRVYIPAAEPKVKRAFDHSDIGDIDQNELIKLIPDGWELRETVNNDTYFPLKRVQQVPCLICNLIHKSNNQYIIICGRKQRVYFKCHDTDADGKRHQLGVLKPNEVILSQAKGEEDEDEIFIRKNTSLIHSSQSKTSQIQVNPGPIFEILGESSDERTFSPNHRLTITIYNNRYVKSVKLVENTITMVGSFLGTGKTSAFIEIVRTNNFPRVLILSPRRLYAVSITNEYNSTEHRIPKVGEDFHCYLNLREERTNIMSVNRLVISMESLHKLHSVPRFDLLILDEVEALFAQFSSSTMKKTKRSAEVFQRLLFDTPYIVGGDAFMSQRSLNVLQAFKPLKYIKNKYVPIKRKAIRYQPKALLFEFRNDVMADKKIVVVCGSKKKAREFARLCDIDAVSYKLYVGESDNPLRDMEELTNVRKYWSDVQVVIYTSTITVGVNYDIEGEFDLLYVWGSSRGSIVRDIFQGTMRVRHLNDNTMKFAMYSRPRNNNLPKTYEAVENELNIHCQYIKTCTPQITFLEIHNSKGKVDEERQNAALKILQQWEHSPVWLKYIHVYTILEHNLSTLCYQSIFESYLNKCNYDLGDVKCEEVEDLGIKGDEPKFSYNEIPTVNESTYQEYKQKVGIGMATLIEKEMVRKYEFDKSVESDRPIWYDRFTETPEGWSHFYNIKREKFPNYTRYMDDKYIEMAPKVLGRTNSIKLICNVLGMSNSCDPMNYDDSTFRARMDIVRQMPSPTPEHVSMENHFIKYWGLSESSDTDPVERMFKYTSKAFEKYNGVPIKKVRTNKSNKNRTYGYTKEGLPIWDKLRLFDEHHSHTYVEHGKSDMVEQFLQRNPEMLNTLTEQIAKLKIGVTCLSEIDNTPVVSTI